MNIMRKKMLLGIAVLAGILSLQACVHGTRLTIGAGARK